VFEWRIHDDIDLLVDLADRDHTSLAVVAAGIVPLNSVATKNSARILEVEATFGDVLVASICRTRLLL